MRRTTGQSLTTRSPSAYSFRMPRPPQAQSNDACSKKSMPLNCREASLRCEHVWTGEVRSCIAGSAPRREHAVLYRPLAIRAWSRTKMASSRQSRLRLKPGVSAVNGKRGHHVRHDRVLRRHDTNSRIIRSSHSPRQFSLRKDSPVFRETNIDNPAERRTLMNPVRFLGDALRTAHKINSVLVANTGNGAEPTHC